MPRNDESFAFRISADQTVSHNLRQGTAGVSKMDSRAKMTPQRFDPQAPDFSKAKARQALQEDGAIIVTNLDDGGGPWSEIAASVPHHVWNKDQLLLKRHRADPVHKEHQQTQLQGRALPPHSDGYMWADCYPDLVILACEEPASSGGGANYLIDGHAVLNRLNPATRALLETEPVDHTERKKKDCLGAESIVPVFRYLEPKGWREEGRNLCWRRMVSNASKYTLPATGEKVAYTSLWTPSPGSTKEQTEAILAALHQVDQAIAVESIEAPRFTLEKGEALIVDNFRMLHSRDGFDGGQRKMWRIWSWTNAAFGLPPQIEPSGKNVPSNVLEARNDIHVGVQQ